MTELSNYMKIVRSYEISIWTLQDRFLSVLKWATMDQKGEVQDPEMVLRDDGTQEFSFSIPMFYYDNDIRILNPLWHKLDEQPLKANMHKLKVIFNKNAGQNLIQDSQSFTIKLNRVLQRLLPANYKEIHFNSDLFENKTINQAYSVIIETIQDTITSLTITQQEALFSRIKFIINPERVFEFLVVSVTEDHTQDNVLITIKTEGLAFHELGKIGYKISLSQENFELDEEEWFKNGAQGECLMNIQYWNDKVFLDSNKNWSTNWTYEVQMDWSAYNDQKNRDSSKVYEDEYVSSWEITDMKIMPRAIRTYDEKERPIDVSESNIYNITQTIAEQFHVFCRYEYDHDDNYQITNRRVIYYNNYIKDAEGHLDLTYPYDSSAITRTSDNTDLITKMYVHTVEQDSNDITIMDVDANKSREDYLLNFDYLYEIGAITEEQHDAIEEYEYNIRRVNDNLVSISERIRILTNQLIDIDAAYTTAANALAIDDEQLNDAKKLQQALTNGTDLIDITAHTRTVIDGTSKGYGKYIKITELGVEKGTLVLYEAVDKDTGGFKNVITGWQAITDEYGNIKRIQNINTKESPIYITGKYNPHHYYEKLLDTWGKRKELDEIAMQEAEEKQALYNWYLYGSRVGYGLASSARLDGAYAGLGIIMNDLPYTSDGGFLSNLVGECRCTDDDTLKTITIDSDTGLPVLIDYFENFDIENTSPELYYHYEEWLKKKEQYINSFNKMMGPALREGYWQPEDYHDYGDVYVDNFLIYPPQTGVIYINANSQDGYLLIDSNNRELLVKSTTSVDNEYSALLEDLGRTLYDRNNLQLLIPTAGESKTNTEHLQFIWDSEKLYDNEEPVTYQSSIKGEYDWHIMVRLEAEWLDVLKDRLDELCFIYYDSGAQNEIRLLEKSIVETQADTTISADQKEVKIQTQRNAIESIKNSGGYRTVFGLKASCELGWVIKDARDIPTPVLIITGAKEYPKDEIRYIVTGKYTVQELDEDLNYVTTEYSSSYRPYIGTYDVDENNTSSTVINSEEIFRLTEDYFLGPAGHTDEEIAASLVDDNIWNNVYTTYTRVFPRLYFDTLKLKNNTSDLRISLNGHVLTDLEDYYTVADDRSKGLNVKGAGYYTTLKPEALFAIGNTTAQIDIVYTLSNVDVSIYLDAIKVMKENAYPKVTYDVELSALNPELLYTTYDKLNQIVRINDNDLKFEDVNGYISEINMKLDKPWEDTVQIKNYQTKFEDLFSTIVAQTEAMKKSEGGLNAAIQAFSYNGLINKDIITNSILSADLNYSFNQGALTITQNEGIWGESDSGVVAFRGGGIFTATEKDSNGNWKWNTGILPSGINANLITAGQLDTNRIKIYAGDQLRFQWDGDGLYAYKSAPDGIESENDVDPWQYIVYNSEGLFLKTKKGFSYINSDGETDTTQEEVSNVEVSWDGFILRNFSGDKVFFADEKGNLTLKGTIAATGGTIAGWTIGAESLSSSTINLVSAKSTGGIYLTPSTPMANTLTVGNTMYYIYEYQNGDNIVRCYTNIHDAVTFAYSTQNDAGKVYDIQYEVIGYQPVRKIEISDSNNIAHIYVSDLNEEAEGALMTTGDTPHSIEWDGVEKIEDAKKESAEDSNYKWWVDEVKDSYPDTWSTYINELKDYVLSALTIPNGTILNQVGFSSTFSVKAEDGDTTIKKGTIGNITIGADGNLYGSLDATGAKYQGSISNIQLDLNNYVNVGSTTIQLGEFIYSCGYNATNKTLELKQLNGNVISVNIGASSTDSGSGGDSGGGSSTCGSCGSSCGTTCNIYCGSGCALECGRACASSCANSCVGSCKSGCTGSSTGSGGCFSKGTKILTGTCTWKNIEDIKIGDIVMSYDIDSNTFSPQPISKVYTHENTSKVIKVYLSNGIILKMTPGHPLLTNEGWKSRDIQNSMEEHNTVATLLEIGDVLIGYKENLTVENIEEMIIPDNYTTYNAEVDTYHTFIAEGIVAHNVKSVT